MENIWQPSFENHSIRLEGILSDESVEQLQIISKAPWVSSKVRKAAMTLLQNEAFVKHSKNLESAKNELQAIFSPDLSDHPMFRTELSKKESFQFGETARLMGACPFSENRLIEKYGADGIPSKSEIKKSEDAYYKEWLGLKVGFRKKELANVSMNAVELRAREDLHEAIDFVVEYVGYMDGKDRSDASSFRSQYFSKIHDKSAQFSIRDYISMYMEFHESKLRARNEGRMQAFRDYEKAQWEIRRLLTLTMMFRETERTPDALLHRMDDEVLTDKMKSVIVQPEGGVDIPPEGTANKLYAFTTSQDIAWARVFDEFGNFSHYVSRDIWPDEDFPEHFTKDTLESAIIRWKTNPWHSDSKILEIPLRHLQIRRYKGRKSILEKLLRKPGSVILDQAGIVMVLDDFSQVDTLADVLVSELGTMGTSFKERLDRVGNGQTNSEYSCRKCVIKIPHSYQNIKANATDATNAMSAVQQSMETLPKKKRRHMESKMQEFTKHIESLSKIAAELGRDLYVEVQFFDLPSYIAAELDEQHSAHHERYKRRQRRLEIAPLLFPEKIYGKRPLLSVYRKQLAEKYNLRPEEIYGN